MKNAERPALRRWTRHEYERLIDHGFLDEDEPIELLDGLLLVKEPQSKPAQDGGAARGEDARACVRRWLVRSGAESDRPR